MSSHLTVQAFDSRAGISPADWLRLINSWNPKETEPRFLERFDNGASLWVIRAKGEICGYGWTMLGKTPEPYFFPLCREDAYVFDLFVFPEFRGKGVIGFLVSQMLETFSASWANRAYVEVKEWNAASLSALKKTRFVRHTIGLAHKRTVFGHTFVRWY